MARALLGVALLVAWCGSVFGNTGVFYGSGHTLQLIKSADVRMVSEDVTITPICGVSAMMQSVDVRCVFVLKNLSAKTVKIQAGFPLDSEFHDLSRPPDDADEVLSRHFIARDASNTYHVRHVAAGQSKYPELFLWDMEFAAGETKKLHVGYILPMSLAGNTTRKPDDLPTLPAGTVNDEEKFLFHVPPQYEKPWHARIEGCTVLYFSYITETGQSWAGPIDKATFRFSNGVFEHCLRQFPEYVGGNPADLPRGVGLPDEDALADESMRWSGLVWGMKLGTVYPRISPAGWKSAYIPEIPAGEPKPNYEPGGIAWNLEHYKPGTPLRFAYYLVGFPETPANCDPRVRCVLGKTPIKADVLELREIVAAFFGVAPQTASVKRLVEQQVWYNAQSKMAESQLSEPRRAVLARLSAIASARKNAPANVTAKAPPPTAQEPGLRDTLKGHAARPR